MKRRGHSAWALLLAEPQRFRFDAGIRVALHAARDPDPAAAMRFRGRAGLAYPAAEIAVVEAPQGGEPARVTTTLMGLTGPSGVLPRHYSEAVTATLRDRSRALADFTDLLAHRMVAGFARAGTKYRLHRSAELARLARNGAPDAVTRVLLALTGYGTPHLAGRLATGTDPLLHYAGLFAARPRSADRLQALVSDWLGRPVAVQQFVGAWLDLPPSQRTRMPAGRRPGAYHRLGLDAAIGVRAWDIQASIVIRVGPLDAASFAGMLPDRPALRRLVGLVRAYLGFETGFAVNPVLARGAVPKLRMGEGRLGWNTWLPQQTPRLRDADEAAFAAEIVEMTK